LVVLQFGIDGGVTAVLCVADSTVREWSAHDLDVLTDIAALIVMQIRRELRVREKPWRQRVIEEARRYTEERYRRLFESSRDAIYMTTRDGRFADANTSMLDMFGYSRRELLGTAGRRPLPESERSHPISRRSSQARIRATTRGQTAAAGWQELDCLVSATVQNQAKARLLVTKASSRHHGTKALRETAGA
jgi:PAS domain-containing protein